MTARHVRLIFTLALVGGVLGVLCVLNVVAGNRPDTAPPDPWIMRWEGWVLGQTAMPAKGFGLPPG